MLIGEEIISLRRYPLDYFNKMVVDVITDWEQKIINNEHFNLVRYGDGEFTCMMGGNGMNCDRHPYSPALGAKLVDSFNYFIDLDNTWFGEWGDQPGSFGTPQGVAPQKNMNTPVFQYQQQLFEGKEIKLVNFEILHNHTIYNEKRSFWKTIKESDRLKIFIGPPRLHDVNKFLNTNAQVVIPLVNSFEHYDETRDIILRLIKDDAILLFAAGMPCECYMHDILKNNSNLTCLDVGSGFDPVFCGNTREGQLDENTLREFYGDLL